MGPATYDLASLLRDSYVDLDEEFVAEQAEEFRQQAAPGEARETFRRRFELISRAAEPEGPGHVRLHGDGPRQPTSTCRTSRGPWPTCGATWCGIPSSRACAGCSRRHVEELAEGDSVRDRRSGLRQPRRRGSPPPRLAPQQEVERQAPVPDRCATAAASPRPWWRRRRCPPRPGRRADKAGQESSLELTGAVQGGQAGARRLRDRRRPACGVLQSVHDYPDHAQGARHRVPDGAPPPVAALAATARDHPRAPHGGEGRPRLPRRPGLHPRRHADLHPRRLRGDDDPLRRAVLRRGHGLPDPERPALQRGHGRGPRQGLLLRPHLPRREVEDAPAPHRVLDGGARDRLRAPRRRRGPRRGPGLPRGRARPRDAGRRSSTTLERDIASSRT